jgi:phosphoribosylformimino-5-aminoimidazole carboxamide ribotide isomerase
MNLYPAIDLKDGQCVRLLRGEMDLATVFSDHPAEQAKKFQQEGFQWLHLVDLNGAFAGYPVNREAVESILKTVSLPVQLGGGIRDMQTIALWLEAGVKRVIIGTAALLHPQLVKEACAYYPGRIVVGIDAKQGKVAVNGWAEVSEITAKELALRFEDAGVSAIIYTDIQRDGAMEGPNIAETVALAEALTIPVIISGGVSRLQDLKEIKAVTGKGIEGAIIGRALYDGAIDPRKALELARTETV